MNSTQKYEQVLLNIKQNNKPHAGASVPLVSEYQQSSLYLRERHARAHNKK